MADPFWSIHGMCLAIDEDGVPLYLGAPLPQSSIRDASLRASRDRLPTLEAERERARVFAVVRRRVGREA